MDEENKILEENIKRHISVLVEGMNGQFKLLAEGQQSLGEKFDLMADDMDHVKSDIVDMKRDIKEIKGDIVEIKSDIVEIRSDITEINGKLDKKADQKVVEGHEKRLVKLENAALAEA